MNSRTPILRHSLLSLCGAVLLGHSLASHGASISDGRTAVALPEVRAELAALPAEIRAGMSRDQMAQFIANMLLDRRLEKAAIAAGTDRLPEVRASIARATRNTVVRAFVEAEIAKVAETLPNLDALAKERYETNKASYVLPDAIRVAHILLKVDPETPESSDGAVRAKAEKLLAEIREGGDFRALAEKHSADPGSAKRGGELPGWAEKGKLVGPFEEAAYALKPGELSGPVRTRFGYHIIKLLEKRPARQLPFDEVKDQLVKALHNEFLTAKRAEWMKTFEGDKAIVLDDATYEGLKKP